MKGGLIIENKVYFIGPDELYLGSTLYIKAKIQDCISWIKDKKWISLDTETEGLFNHKNRIIMLQLSDGKDIYVIDTRNNRSIFKLLKPYLESILVLGQNLKFDYKFLKLEGVELDNIYDTFLVECIVTNGKEFELESGRVGRELALDKIVKRYLGESLDKSVRNQFIGLKGQPFTDVQIVYGSKDVLYLDKIKDKQKLRIDKYDLQEYVDLENNACLALADIEYNGLKVDTLKWAKLAKEVNEKLPEYEVELDNLVRENPKLSKWVNKAPQGNLFGGTDRDITVSWSSPVQVLRLFNTLLGTKLLTSQEKEINKYQEEYPLIKRFIDYKKDSKLATTYGTNFLQHINSTTGRVHGDIWQVLNTGRVSFGGSKSGGKSSVNLQNLPAKNEYLNCFVADYGNKIIGVDYSAQEGRCAAAFSKDEVWLNTFKEGKDLHGEVCKMMFGITDDLVKTKPDFLRGKSYRDVAKTINFMALFGGTEYKLSKILMIPKEEAKLLLNKYFEATNQLQSFLSKCADYGLSRGYIRSAKPYSGIRWLPTWKPNLDPYGDSKTIQEITRICYNTPIQMTCAIMTKLALVNLRRYIKDNYLQDKVKIVHVVHDAILTEVSEDIAEDFAKIQCKIMTDAGRVFTDELEFETDPCIAPYWQK